MALYEPVYSLVQSDQPAIKTKVVMEWGFILCHLWS